MSALQHRWDGDGMAQAFAIDGGRVTHRACIVETKKSVAERAAGVFLLSGFGSNMPERNAIGLDIDEMNAANISVAMIGGELLALREPGSAYRIDPMTLATIGLKEWEDHGLLRPISAARESANRRVLH